MAANYFGIRRRGERRPPPWPYRPASLLGISEPGRPLVTRVDRLARSLKDLQNIVRLLRKR
jgi:hypothetical protein